MQLIRHSRVKFNLAQTLGSLAEVVNWESFRPATSLWFAECRVKVHVTAFHSAYVRCIQVQTIDNSRTPARWRACFIGKSQMKSVSPSVSLFFHSAVFTHSSFFRSPSRLPYHHPSRSFLLAPSLHPSSTRSLHVSVIPISLGHFPSSLTLPQWRIFLWIVFACNMLCYMVLW